MLMDRGASFQYNEKERYINIAAEFGHVPMLRFLMDQGLNLHVRDLMYKAAGGGHVPMLQFLLEQGCAVEKPCRSSLDFRPLEHAVECGHMEAFKFLLANGADLRYRSHYGMTVWLDVASYGKLEMMKFLLDNNMASPSDRDNAENTALLVAAWVCDYACGCCD